MKTNTTPRSGAWKIRSNALQSALLVSILAVSILTGGCQTLQKPATAAHWEQTRLDVALQLADENIIAGKFERARRSLAAYHDTTDPRLQTALARMDVEEGHYPAALQRLDGITETAIELTAWHQLRGVALEGLGRWQAAAAAYERAYELQPTVHLLTAWLDALASDGKLDEALAALERERGQFPGQAPLNMLAARLHARAGDFDAACSELQTAQLAQPESREISRRLAETLAAAGRHAEAIEIWQTLIADCRDTDQRQRYRRHLADCLTAARRFNEARTVYRAIVLTKPDNDAAYLGLAAACLALGEPAEALEAASQVMKHAPGDTEARLIAAICHRHLNQTARALELLSDIATDGNDAALVRELRRKWQQH